MGQNFALTGTVSLWERVKSLKVNGQWGQNNKTLTVFCNRHCTQRLSQLQGLGVPLVPSGFLVATPQAGCPESHSGFRGAIDSVSKCTVSAHRENVNDGHLQWFDCINHCKITGRLGEMQWFCNDFTQRKTSFAMQSHGELERSAQNRHPKPRDTSHCRIQKTHRRLVKATHERAAF